MVEMETQVKDLKEGDRFSDNGTGWVAKEDAMPVQNDGSVTIMVQYEPDGALGYRTWDDPTRTLRIERSDA